MFDYRQPSITEYDIRQSYRWILHSVSNVLCTRISVSSLGMTAKMGVAGGLDTRRGRLRCLLVSGEQSQSGTQTHPTTSKHIGAPSGMRGLRQS